MGRHVHAQAPAVNPFQRLPGHRPVAPGLEWTLWKRLPAVLAWGTALPLALAGVLWLRAPTAALAGGHDSTLLTIYQLLGLVVLHWTLVLTAAIGCLIVRVMKGPAYVADAYPPPGRDTGSAPDRSP
jgi:hypothetical protein